MSINQNFETFNKFKQFWEELFEYEARKRIKTFHANCEGKMFFQENLIYTLEEM
jgi:hypothetical protein